MPMSQRKLPALLLCSASPTERMEAPQQVAEQHSGESGLFPFYLGLTLFPVQIGCKLNQEYIHVSTYPSKRETCKV